MQLDSSAGGREEEEIGGVKAAAHRLPYPGPVQCTVNLWGLSFPRPLGALGHWVRRAAPTVAAWGIAFPTAPSWRPLGRRPLRQPRLAAAFVPQDLFNRL